MHILIKFGYIGWQFTGFQRGNGDNSVEDTILKVLRKTGISEEIHCGARTDRGVSALSNTFTMETDKNPSMVMGILNGKISGMVFHSYSIVPEGFNPRHCDYKTYRYILRKERVGPYLRKSLKPFRGQHDFRNFCKMDRRNPVRTIKSIAVGSRGDWISIDYKARSFLWNQIRAITAYAVEHSFTEEQADPFSLTEKYPGLLDPEGLLLIDIVYDGIQFQDGVSVSKKKQFNSLINSYNLRNDIINNFSSLLKRQ